MMPRWPASMSEPAASIKPASFMRRAVFCVALSNLSASLWMLSNDASPSASVMNNTEPKLIKSFLPIVICEPMVFFSCLTSFPPDLQCFVYHQVGIAVSLTRCRDLEEGAGKPQQTYQPFHQD